MPAAIRSAAFIVVATLTLAACMCGESGAAIVQGPPGGIIAPPASVDDDFPLGGCAAGAVTAGQRGFNERQAVVLPAAIQIDPGGVTIPAGTRVDSHMIFFNTAGGGAGAATETWCFDGPIIGVMSDVNGTFEAASNPLLAWPGTCYPGGFANRGLESALGDRYRYHGNTIEITMNVNAPGDWIRVITTREPALGVTFSFDAPSASRGAPDAFTGARMEEGDLLTVGRPKFRLPNPAVSPSPTPGILAQSIGLGIVATPAGYSELDALSFGRDAGSYFVFSVDEWAVGCNGGGGCTMPSAVFPEGACTWVGVGCGMATLGEAAADVFGSDAFAGGPGGNWKIFDGNGVIYPGFGLVEPNIPAAGVPDAGDNLDALDVGTRAEDLSGPIYFSLEGGLFDPLEGVFGTNTALANGVSGADILLLQSCDAIAPVVYATAAQLRLNPAADDVDAIAILDNGDGIYQPGVDQIYYSVRRGSAVIGTMDCGGVNITEGDILTVQPGCPVPRIAVSHGDLGLRGRDDLDALDRVTALERTSVELGALGTGHDRLFLGSVEPNPFNPETRLHFAVPAGGAKVTIAVYDVRGTRVRTLVDEFRAAGDYSERWDGCDNHGKRAESGVYFLRYDAPGVRETRKVTLLK